MTRGTDAAGWTFVALVVIPLILIGLALVSCCVFGIFAAFTS